VLLVLGLIIGAGVGFFAGNSAGKQTSSSQKKMENNEQFREIERYKTRIRELEEQVEKLTAANNRHRNNEKDTDDEIEDLEDELSSAKKKIKELQSKNSNLEAQIFDLKNEIASLKTN